MSADRTCPHCGSRHVDAVHEARCAYRAACRDDVTARAKALGIPETTATDLFAHLGDIYQDGSLAYRAALDVMHLGWRPVVGSNRARLWKQQPEAREAS